MRTGSIYFIQAEPDGLVKIGFTVRPPEKRLAEIQPSSPVELTLRATIPRVSKEVERELHQRFSSSHVHGEWFEPHSDMPHVVIDGKKTVSDIDADDPTEAVLDATLRRLEA
jgi:hypothetical protein